MSETRKGSEIAHLKEELRKIQERKRIERQAHFLMPPKMIPDEVLEQHLAAVEGGPWVPVDKYEGLQEGAAYVVRQVYTHSPGDERVVVLDYMGRGYWKRGVNEDEPDGDSDWEVTHVHLVGKVA